MFQDFTYNCHIEMNMNGMHSKRFVILLAVSALAFSLTIPMPAGAGLSIMDDPAGEDFSTSKFAGNWPRDVNPVHMVVVFTKFKGEAPGDSIAPAWADEIFNGQPGSVNDFFNKVSFGVYRITGQYLPKRYELPHEENFYVQNRSQYAIDVLNLLKEDPTIDFSRFDNDGGDMIPGSADDDHYVDYLVLMPMSRPYDFIQKWATGVWTLGLLETYYTNNKSSDGFWIKLDKFSGCIAMANSKNEAVGTIVAEIAHAYGDGALDLMDKIWDADDPETDSAGVGYWDFLGKGALGWEEHEGPMGPSAYNRLRMDSIGKYNTNLTDLYGFQEGVSIKDVGQLDGRIYRVWISSREYFLIEYRRSAGLWYDRYIPQDGLLIWHVLYGETNNNETKKLCDLECADGRYTDAGYPLGKRPDPINGGDNLDFWSHNDVYNTVHSGNAGDSFDVFDGIKFTQFGTETNPNSYSKVTNRKTGIEIFNIRAAGDSMVFDCIIPPFHNWFEEKYPFIGSGFHRFASTGVENVMKPAGKEVYLVRTGGGRKPETLVTIENGELRAEPLSMLAAYEIDFMVAQELMTSEEHFRDARLVRRNVRLDEFESRLLPYNVSLAELGKEDMPTLVQQVIRVAGDDVRPKTISLYQNHPNPFNSYTTINYVLPAESAVALEVYNVLGQQVMYIDEGYKGIGMHAIQFDAGGLASGVYLYLLRANGSRTSKKFTLIR